MDRPACRKAILRARHQVAEVRALEAHFGTPPSRLAAAKDKLRRLQDDMREACR